MFLSYSFVKSLHESPHLSQIIIAKFLFVSNFFGKKLLILEKATLFKLVAPWWIYPLINLLIFKKKEELWVIDKPSYCWFRLILKLLLHTAHPHNITPNEWILDFQLYMIISIYLTQFWTIFDYLPFWQITLIWNY